MKQHDWQLSPAWVQSGRCMDRKLTLWLHCSTTTGQTLIQNYVTITSWQSSYRWYFGFIFFIVGGEVEMCSNVKKQKCPAVYSEYFSSFSTFQHSLLVMTDSRGPCCSSSGRQLCEKWELFCVLVMQHHSYILSALKHSTVRYNDVPFLWLCIHMLVWERRYQAS